MVSKGAKKFFGRLGGAIEKTAGRTVDLGFNYASIPMNMSKSMNGVVDGVGSMLKNPVLLPVLGVMGVIALMVMMKK